jgi:hypothetical protein
METKAGNLVRPSVSADQGARSQPVLVLVDTWVTTHCFPKNTPKAHFDEICSRAVVHAMSIIDREREVTAGRYATPTHCIQKPSITSVDVTSP